MAWENANIQMQFLGTLTNAGLSEYCNKSNGWYQYNNNISSFRSTYGTVNTSDTDLRYVSSSITLLENSVGKVILRYSNRLVDLEIYIGSTQIYMTRVCNQTNNWAQYFTLWACIDEVNRLGAFIYAYTQQGGSSIYISVCNSTSGGGAYKTVNAYNLIKESIIPTYNWQSVPSISGKNGILSLAQIKEEYINDGEPVSGAAKSRFSNLKDGNKVSVLIENVLPDPAATGTDVTVKYDVPSLSSGSYTYCKLVAKKNSMPESVTDGNKIIDLDPTKASVTVKYLSGHTKYYFEIFTQDSEGHEGVSNVKSITTGEAHDIVLFTNEFNEDVLPEGWSLSNYKSGFGTANNQWDPQQFSSDYLSAYNFLIGNSSRRMIYVENEKLVANQQTGATDAILWIPVQRSIVPEEFKLEFDGKVSPTGYSSYDYNYTNICVGCVDENNGWHQSAQAGGVTSNDFTHYEANITNWTYGYIDYIGLGDCDGKPHFKNIKVTVG